MHSLTPVLQVDSGMACYQQLANQGRPERSAGGLCMVGMSTAVGIFGLLGQDGITSTPAANDSDPAGVQYSAARACKIDPPLPWRARSRTERDGQQHEPGADSLGYVPPTWPPVPVQGSPAIGCRAPVVCHGPGGPRDRGALMSPIQTTPTYRLIFAGDDYPVPVD